MLMAELKQKNAAGEVGFWTDGWDGYAAARERLLRFIADRKVPLKRLLTHRFALEQAADAYRLFDTQTTGKGVFS